MTRKGLFFFFFFFLLYPSQPTGKAGPVVTDNGGFIIDCDFGEIDNPMELHNRLRNIVGVVETGLFVNMASVAYFGQSDGTVIRWDKQSQTKLQ